jgi:ATP-dependent Lon protease
MKSGLKPRVALEQALPAMPVFPLPAAVLFPGGHLALHVFEPRYRAMLTHCLDTHRCMAVSRLLDGQELPDGRPVFEPVAGVGLIVEHESLDDGRSNILLQGVARVRLHELPQEGLFRRARAEVLHEVQAPVDPRDLAVLVQVAGSFVVQVRARNPASNLRMPPDVHGTKLLDAIAQDLVVDARERQRLLEELDPRERMRRTLAAVAGQLEVLHQDGGRSGAN